MKNLPEDSRLRKELIGEASLFDIQSHLLADIRDILNVEAYFSGISATKDLKKSQVNKVHRGIPKRIRRPGDPEPEVHFATPEELAMLFGDKKMQQRLQRRQQRKQQL
jgi:hypothetical protein